jgi:CheY-like chemotaxis protein
VNGAKFGTCLLVEDAASHLVALRQMLMKLGFDVVEATDGLAAKEAIEGFTPHEVSRLKLILSDYLMPNLDGIELLKYVRSRADIEKVPFIVFTGVNDANLIVQIAKLSASDYLLKPISYMRLRDVLSRLFPDQRFEFEEPNFIPKVTSKKKKA